MVLLANRVRAKVDEETITSVSSAVEYFST
jgi:hypothetical protein